MSRASRGDRPSMPVLSSRPPVFSLRNNCLETQAGLDVYLLSIQPVFQWDLLLVQDGLFTLVLELVVCASLILWTRSGHCLLSHRLPRAGFACLAVG